MFLAVLKSYWYYVVIALLLFLLKSELKINSEVHRITIERVVFKSLKSQSNKKTTKEKFTEIKKPTGETIVITEKTKQQETIAKVKIETVEEVIKEETRNESKNGSVLRFGLGVGIVKPGNVRLDELNVLGSVEIIPINIELVLQYFPLKNNYALGVIWKF